MAKTFEALRRFFLPWWMLDDEADGAFATALSRTIDEHVSRMRSGMEQRFPSRAGEAALTLSGADRLLLRGRDETAAHYAARLAAWRYPRGHRVRGSVFGLLEQTAEYFGGGPFCSWGVDATGNRRYRDGVGARLFDRGGAWAWDSLVGWSRQWVVLSNQGAWIDGVYAVTPGPGAPIFAAQPELGDASLWGGALGVDGYSVGVRGASAEDFRAVVALTRGQHRWLPAGVQAEWLVVVLEGDEPTPDATWETWSKSVDVGWVALDGTNDYVDHGAPAALNFERTDSWTFAAWVRDDLDAVQWALFSKRSTEGYVLYRTDARQYYLFVRDDAPASHSCYSTAIPDGWHLVILRVTSMTAGGTSIWINDADATASSSTTLTGSIQSAGNFYVGRYSTVYHSGDIGPYAVWDRVLTDNECAALYAAGRQNTGAAWQATAPLLLALPALDTGGTLTDRGSGGNDGTLTGGAALRVEALAVATRSDAARYVAYRDELREYAGRSTWCNDFPSVDGGTLSGDDTDFPATITLPDGTAYAGDVTDYPETVTLPDDGSAPS